MMMIFYMTKIWLYLIFKTKLQEKRTIIISVWQVESEDAEVE